jgi:hypothetical protein
MITVVVQFDVPAGTTSDDAKERYLGTAPRFRAMPGLLRKYYLFDAKSGKGGGCYLFENRAAAESAFNDEWRGRIRKLYGDPDVQYFETAVVVDNITDQIVEDTAEESDW